MKKGAILVVGLLIGAIVAVGATFAYFQANPVEKTITQTVTQPSKIDMEATWSNSTYDFSSAVDSNGSVATQTTITRYIEVTNDDSNALMGAKLCMYNPADTTEEGFDDALEESYTEVDLIMEGATYPLVSDGEYVQVANIPTIPSLTPDSTYNATIRITLEECTEIYSDGVSYSSELFLYQPEYDASDSYDFTVLT